MIHRIAIINLIRLIIVIVGSHQSAMMTRVGNGLSAPKKARK